MDRSLFLKNLKAQGYKGKPVLADVKAWMDEQGIDSTEVEAGDGTKHKIEDVWAKTAQLKLATEEVDETTAEVDTKDNDGGDTKDANADKVKEAKDRGRKQHVPNGRGLAALEGIAVHTSGRQSAIKRYDARVKMAQSRVLIGKDAPAYGSGDEAEQAGAFLRLALMSIKGRTYAEMANDRDIVGKAMSGDINTAGGVLIPPGYLPELIYLTEGYGVARKLSQVLPMSRDTLTIPRQTGLVTFAFRGQNASMTAADIPADDVNLVAKEAYGYTLVSNELLQDSAVNVSDMIGRAYAEGALKIEDNCYINGDGTATYGNMVGLTQGLQTPGSVGTTGTSYYDCTGSAWSAITEADIQTAIGLLENVQGGDISILCSRQFFVQVFQRLSSGAGGRTQAEFNTNRILGDAFGNADAMYQGIPVYFSQVMATVSASTGRMCYIGAFNTATKIGDRQEFRIDNSEHVGFASNQMAFRAIKRFDVAIHGSGRGDTYGPIMALCTG